MTAPARSTYIGSADAPPIIGVPSYGRTELDVWDEKVGQVAERETDAAMRWGSRLEPVIIAAYEEETGRKVDRGTRFHRHPEHSFIGCTVDGLASDRIVEAKFAPFGEFGEPADGVEGLPPYVRVQIQHQMMVTGHRLVDVPVLVRGYDLRIFEVEADPAYLDDLEQEEVEWWNAYVVPRIPPPVDEEDPEQYGRFLLRQHPIDDGSTVVATEEQGALLRDYRLAKLAEAQAKERQKFLRTTIEKVMGVATRFEAPGIGYVTWKRTADSHPVAWELVAGAYRRMLESRKHPDGAPIRGKVGGEALDTIRELYTRTEPGTRRFGPPRFDQDTPQEGSITSANDDT